MLWSINASRQRAPAPRATAAILGLFAVAALCGCATGPRQGDLASGRAASQVPISVSCTLTVATAEPCRAEAERQCGGAARLLNITMAEALPRPMANQGAAGQRVYQASYECRR